MTTRSTVHSTFVIERIYDAPPAKVFAAFADPVAKLRWFAGPAEWVRLEHKLDFRVGGKEVSRGGPEGGTIHAFNAEYLDIVPNQRIIYAYDMHLDEKRISVSLTTVELKPAGKGTRLVFTEQGAFLDDFDDAGSREHGSRWLLEKLGESLS